MTDQYDADGDYTGPIVAGDVANQITLDIGNGVAPKDSKIKYGPKELAFRKEVEDEFAAIRKEHPDAILDIRE